MKIAVRLFAVAALLFLALPQPSSAQGPVTFKATLSWADNSTNEDGFRIERSDGSGLPFTQVGSVAANVVSYVDQPIAIGATVCYRIIAFNVAGPSAPSTVACANAPSLPAAPGAVQIIITVNP